MDVLLEENNQLWTSYIRNDFCWQMAVSRTPIDPRFKAYAIQDFVWRWEDVRQVAVHTAAAPNIPELAVYSKKIYGTYIYAMDWKKTCIDHLTIDEETLMSAQAAHPVKDYLDWMKQLGREGNWLDLHVLMIPCLQGYYDIARLIEAEAQRPLNHKFYEHWVKPNNTDIHAKRLHEWFDRNSPWYYHTPAKRRRWSYIFRKTTLLEMRMFAYFLGKPLPDDPHIPIGSGSIIPGD
ncbi:hypothetical protein FS837_009611 [Tulasnella sp. UAMH 9824]|nr:hypothetical protein FS837_009611 [Tulasnella sp. UAMH 9824]